MTVRSGRSARVDPIHSWCQLGCVGRVAAFDVVVHDHAVVAFGELGLVAGLDWVAEPSLGVWPGVGVVQADSRGGSVRGLSIEPLSGLRGDPPGLGGQVLEVVDGAGDASRRRLAAASCSPAGLHRRVRRNLVVRSTVASVALEGRPSFS